MESRTILRRFSLAGLADMCGQRKAAAAVLATVVVTITGCHSATAPSGGACGSSLTFTTLPVPVDAILAATPIGNMGPPVHTIPTDHAGFYLTRSGVTLSSPAPVRINEVRTTEYLASPFRAGTSDFTVGGNLCNGYQLRLGHLQSLVATIQSQASGGNCSTYSTANESIRYCENNHANVSLGAGDEIGTVGGPTAGAFDFGVYQNGRQNAFVNPARMSSLTLTAICPYDPFTPDLRALIDARIGEPGQLASGESPRCGTMEVDVAGTAQGVWVLQSAPVNQQGDESNFAVLAPHPLFPQSRQAFSLGPASLIPDGGGPGLPKFPVTTSGRVNRPFRDVTSDGAVYCYVYDASAATFSYFVRLNGSVLAIQKVQHGFGATPCAADPSTWAMGSTAVNFIR